MSQKLLKYLPLIIGILSLFVALFSLIYSIINISDAIQAISKWGLTNNLKYDYYQIRPIILGIVYLIILPSSLICGIILIKRFVKNESQLPICLKLTQMVFAFEFIVLFVCDMIIEQHVYISYPLFIVVAVLVITLGFLSISKVGTKKEQILSLIFGILSFTLLSQFTIDSIVSYSMVLTFEAVGIFYIVSLISTSSKKETNEVNQVEDKQEEIVNEEPEAEEEFEEETPVEDEDLETEEEFEEETPVEDEELETKEENEEKSEEPKKDDAFDVTAKVEAPNFD